MRIYALVLVVSVAYIRADCGCLKCSKHLQGIDIRGPNGCPIKVVFRRPHLQYECKTASHTPTVQFPVPAPPSVPLPGKSYNYKVQYCHKPIYRQIDDCGGQKYSAKLQAPLPPVPKVSRLPLLNNLKYRTDTVLVPPPNCAELTVSQPALSIDLINWLKDLAQSESASPPEVSTGPIFETLHCCDCDRFDRVPILTNNCIVNRAKRSLSGRDCTRHKRDVAKTSYDFLIKMLPQFVREPVRHSVQGVYTEPKLSLHQKLKKPKTDKSSLHNQGWLPKFHDRSKSKNTLETSNFLPNFSKKPALPESQAALLNSKLKLLAQNVGFPGRAKANPPADETVLLKKLKKLNSNPFSSNIEDQATDFMTKLLRPAHKRSKRATATQKNELSRKKRTIILSSDEIDLPPHYEVNFVSVEDEELEQDEFSDEQPESPLVGGSSLLPKLYKPPQRVFGGLPRFPAKPDVIMGKNVIQKAVRDELNAYHKKVEREDKLKANLLRRQASVVPQNPIFMLLTAPMKFLKHFHGLNKGVNPIITTLPKLVYTTKKCFRDFGKNFHKNCLNLASDIIGDFDHVQPNVIQQIPMADHRRYRRDVWGAEPKEEAPDYTPNSSKQARNFREASSERVRKKRYVIKVVDDDEIQGQVEQYLTQKMEDQYSYLKPLQDYYDKVNDFFSKLSFGHHQHEDYPASSEDSSETKPKPKKIQIKQLKPRVIIDNKGLPFMEYDGFKRPLLLNRKVLKKPPAAAPRSSEETDDKIATLIARAKEDSEIVGNARKDFMPQQIIKERISSLLEQIDQLVHLNAEQYDDVFENLIKVQHIKTSIEQDWKRMLIDSRADDIGAKIGLLSKFKDLQQAKDESVVSIAQKLQKNDNEFVRKRLVYSLIRLQKLQCIITSVVEDFEHHLKLRTSFNTKKEIKYVDFLAELKFVYAKTRNDLVRKLCQDRDVQGQKNIELLHKLKKLLISEGDSEKLDHAAKLIWETKNLKKLQTQTIRDMNKKAGRHLKIKKELKILFDLQKRFEDCEAELNELLGNLALKATAKGAPKKDIKLIIAEIKQKHEEMLLKAKERAGGLQRLKNR